MMWWTAVFQEVWTARYQPKNETTWEKMMDAVDAALVSKNPVALVSAARSVSSVPLQWLPYLAAERSVNEFSGAWPEDQQRAVVAGSFLLHQRLGTRAALDRALTPFGYNVKVVEWFETSPRRTPYTFRVEVTIPDDSEWVSAQRRPLIRIANDSKNAHTKLEAIALRRKAPPAVTFVGGVIQRRRVIRVGQVPRPLSTLQTTHVFMGALRRGHRKIIIKPRP